MGQLKEIQDKMQADLKEERELEAEANRVMREDMLTSLTRLEVKSTVSEVLLSVVGRVTERIGREEFETERKTGEEQRLRLEGELREEKHKALQLVDKLERLEVVVNEREKLEAQEWARILEGNSFLQSAEGGGQQEEIGKPVVVGGTDFPARKTES